MERAAQESGQFITTAAHNMILIGAGGRNSGKTTLACKLIRELAPLYPVYALKVIKTSEHGCHRGRTDCGMCCISSEFELVEEKDASSKKDTSMMLRAGSARAFLLKSQEQSMHRAFLEFAATVPKDALIVCESNTLRRFVTPGVFLFAEGSTEFKPSAQLVSGLADWQVPLEEEHVLSKIAIGVKEGALCASFVDRNHTEEVTE